MDFRPAPAPHSLNHFPETPVHPAPAAKPSKPAGKRRRQTAVWLVIIILLLAAIGTAGYYVKRYRDSQAQLKKLSANSQQAAQDQNQQLITKIGELTPLPTGETPTIATVTDITKLKDQAFFANAVNGDKVLIYTQAKKAYLYRPSTNKLINIAPINLGATTTPTTTPAPTSTGTTTKK